jgi:DNA-binding transcriptional LysR family regulator
MMGSGVLWVLTAEGETYHLGVRQLVRNYFSLEDEVRNLHQAVAGRVRVASIYSIGLSHLHQYVGDFMSRHPQANLRLQYQHPDEVYDLVQRDEVDVGLVSYPKSSRNVEAVAWRDEPMVFVCAPDHPLASQTSLAPDWLDGLDWIGFDRGLRIRREIDRFLSSHNAEINMVNEFDNLETIKRAIEINVGVALLPQPTIVREVQLGSLVAIPLAYGESADEPPLHRPLGIIYRRGRSQAPTVVRFIKELQEIDLSVATEGPRLLTSEDRTTDSPVPIRAADIAERA